MKYYKRVLTIAGSDSGGGAGVQADIKTISACGCFATSAITAVTVQNTTGVKGIEILSADLVEAQVQAILEDIGTDAIKLGMLPTTRIVEVVARAIEKFKVRYVVLDPVMVSTSGHRLIDAEAVEAIRELLFPLATLITPNIPEASFLTGIDIRSESDFPEAAHKLQATGVSSVLLKAGHLDTPRIQDWLYTENLQQAFRYDRIKTSNTHGTGCTLSSAIAAYLAHDHLLPEAIGLAEDYIHKAISTGSEYTLGKGHGPVHHFYRFWD